MDTARLHTADRIAIVTRIDTAEDRREQAVEAMTREHPDFAVRFDQAIRIIHDDRLMFLQHSNIPADQRPPCTYAVARKALMAMVARAGDETVDAYKYILEVAVQRVLTEGRRFNTQAEVEKAYLIYKGGQGQ